MKRTLRASTLTILAYQCLFGDAELRIVQDIESKKVYSATQYAIYKG